MSSPTSRFARRELGSASISTRALEHDPRTAELGLEAADTDEDGRISGAEIDSLVAALDRLDGRRDGRIGARRGPRANGRGVAARRALQAVAEVAGADALAQAAKEGLDLSRAVTFVGITRGSLAEARGLRARGVPVELVRDVGTDTVDQGWREGKAMPLGTPKQRRAFVATLGLPETVGARVAKALGDTEPRGRGEIAALAQQWAAAYRSEPIAERLVMSGHGDGFEVFETQGDAVARDDVIQLARAMPEAARHIRHIHVAACQHGYQPRTEPYFGAFPELQSVWGYAGFAPSGATARAHQSRWERATRSDDDRHQVSSSLARGTGRAVSVAVHHRDGRWEGPAVAPFENLDQQARMGDHDFDRLLSGELVVSDPGHGFAADYYQTLQGLSAHHDFSDQSSAYREHWDTRREQTLRLRFYTSHVAPAFEAAHGGSLDATYSALGMKRPDFAHLSRRDAHQAVEALDAEFRRRGEPSDAARGRDLLLQGLMALDPSIIPARWL